MADKRGEDLPATTTTQPLRPAQPVIASTKPAWKGTRLPTFAEVAATVPVGRKLFVEVKDHAKEHPEIGRELAALHEEWEKDLQSK